MPNLADYIATLKEEQNNSKKLISKPDTSSESTELTDEEKKIGAQLDTMCEDKEFLVKIAQQCAKILDSNKSEDLTNLKDCPKRLEELLSTHAQRIEDPEMDMDKLKAANDSLYACAIALCEGLNNTINEKSSSISEAAALSFNKICDKISGYLDKGTLGEEVGVEVREEEVDSAVVVAATESKAAQQAVVKQHKKDTTSAAGDDAPIKCNRREIGKGIAEIIQNLRKAGLNADVVGDNTPVAQESHAARVLAEQTGKEKGGERSAG